GDVVGQAVVGGKAGDDRVVGEPVPQRDQPLRGGAHWPSPSAVGREELARQSVGRRWMSHSRLLDVTASPHEHARPVEERAPCRKYVESRGLQIRREFILVPVVRTNPLARQLEHGVGHQPEQARHRRAHAVLVLDVAEGRPVADVARRVDEDGVATGLEDAPRLAQERERLWMHVDPVNADHDVEGGVAYAGAFRKLAVAEREIGEALGAALFAGELDERAVGFQADRREAGLGEHEREVTGTAADVEHLDLTARRVGCALLNELEHIGLQILVRTKALEDGVVHDAIAHGQHAVEAPLEGSHHRAHDALRRGRAAGLGADRPHQRASFRSASTFSTVPRSSSEVKGFNRIESKPRRFASVMTSGEPWPVTNTTAISGYRPLACWYTSNPVMPGIL